MIMMPKKLIGKRSICKCPAKLFSKKYLFIINRNFFLANSRYTQQEATYLKVASCFHLESFLVSLHNQQERKQVGSCGEMLRPRMNCGESVEMHRGFPNLIPFRHKG